MTSCCRRMPTEEPIATFSAPNQICWQFARADLMLATDGSLPHPDDAAIPAAPRQRAGGYAAALSARRFLRAVFRGRQSCLRPAQPRADQAQRRADVRHAISCREGL